MLGLCCFVLFECCFRSSSIFSSAAFRTLSLLFCFFLLLLLNLCENCLICVEMLLCMLLVCVFCL